MAEGGPQQKGDHDLEIGLRELRDESGPPAGITELPAAPEFECVPQSSMTIAEFVEKVFVPEHVATKKLSGRTHYQSILKHVIMPEEVNRVFRVDQARSRMKVKAVPDWPYLGSFRFCDIRPGDVQRLISSAVAHGYSNQTVIHIRNVVSIIFVHARKKQWFVGDNPASSVDLPARIPSDEHTLTLAQTEKVLGAMQYPEKEMTLIAILTGMNVAEICGLKWKCVNLTEECSTMDGETIPPKTIAVRMKWYRGELGSLGDEGRNRNLPIPRSLLPVLRRLSTRPEFTGPDDFVIVSRKGTPVDARNLAVRRLKPIGDSMQMPWLSWNTFRRTHTALAYELGSHFLKHSVLSIPAET